MRQSILPQQQVWQGPRRLRRVSNLSHSALLEGLEWNVRLSQGETPALLDKFHATFETYWEDGEFEDYAPARDAERFAGALVQARGGVSDSPSVKTSCNALVIVS